MEWRFWKRQEPVEVRQAADYSDAILLSLLNNADGDNADAKPTAASEACCGIWGRSFAVAQVSPENTPAAMALTPRFLFDAGRDLCQYGESVWLIEVERGRIVLQRASNWFVGPDRYQISISTPGSVRTRWVRPDVVLHLQYTRHLQSPWLSASPVEGSGTTQLALSRLESKLADEFKTPLGHIISVPEVKSSKGLQASLRKMKGDLQLVEGSKSWTGESARGGGGAGPGDYKPVRLGPNPPDSIERIRQGLSGHVTAAAGVPSALLDDGADSSALREGWRLYLHGTLAPVAEVMAEEIGNKLDQPGLKFSFNRLFASDLSGRARAFQSMVKGGLPVEKAAALSGLMEEEEE